MISKKYLCCFFLVFFSKQLLFSQILNIEKIRLHADTLQRWHSNLSFNLDIRQRQNQVFNVRSNINTAYLTKKQRHHFIFIGDINLIQNQGKDLISYGYLHGRLHLHSQNRFSWESFSQIQYDQVRGLQNRFLVGQGIRLHATLNSKTTNAFGFALMLEHEHWTFSDKDTTTNLPKISSYWNFHSRLSNILELNTVTYYQATFEYFLKPRISTDVNLLIKISSHFSLVSHLLLAYDQIPVVPIDKLIYQFENGIKVNF